MAISFIKAWFCREINPFYGQGMSVIAMGAECLDSMIHQQSKKDIRLTNLKGLGKQFQKKLSKINYLPWFLTTTEDFRWPTTKGKKPSNPLLKLLQRYLDRVLLLVPYSNEATLAFFGLMHMTESPLVVFRPKIVFQVLVKKWKSKTKND